MRQNYGYFVPLSSARKKLHNHHAAKNIVHTAAEDGTFPWLTGMFCLNGSHVCERLLDNLRENKNGMFLVSVEQINFPVCADESSSGAAYLFVILL